MMTRDEPSSVRLNKFLAERLDIGRRQADTLIEKGRVTVNGDPAALGARVVPTRDIVAVDGRTVSAAEASTYLYVALHKPVGYVCSRRQQGDTPTIYSLLPDRLHHLKPVGRLDKDSSGLLLLTNDGDFAHRMTHPSFHKTKTYQVTLDRALEPLHRQMISDYGVSLDDGHSLLHLTRLHDGSHTAWVVSMHEGRNRQIRRTFAALGYTVTALHRTAFGPYALDGLKKGSHREVPKR